MPDLIGARHPTIQRLRRLSRRRSARSDERAFVIDGPTLLDEALRSGVEVTDVVAEPSADDGILRAAAAAGARVRRTASGVLARAVDTVTPQPVAAIARLPQAAAATVSPAGPLTLVFVGVGDPGNAGTLLRSGEAAGAGAAIFCDGSVDPYGPKCVRASSGALFRLCVRRDADALQVLTGLRAAGVRSVAAVARGGTPYDAVDLAGPVALVVGGEALGLPAEVVKAADERATIPMIGAAESLNVAMAGTVLAFESLRQRRAKGPMGGEAAPGRTVGGGQDEGCGPGNRLDDRWSEAAGCNPP